MAQLYKLRGKNALEAMEEMQEKNHTRGHNRFHLLNSAINFIG
jgi:hypothetical protein